MAQTLALTQPTASQDAGLRGCDCNDSRLGGNSYQSRRPERHRAFTPPPPRTARSHGVTPTRSPRQNAKNPPVSGNLENLSAAPQDVCYQPPGRRGRRGKAAAATKGKSRLPISGDLSADVAVIETLLTFSKIFIFPMMHLSHC